MENQKTDISEVLAWANAFIEKNRELFERMHGYTSEMHRHDELAKQLIETHRKKSPNHEGAR